jgi:peptidyl-prolyl cis-trans isomerase D
VEVGPNQLAAARVLSHQSARTLPLAEVRERVRGRVIANAAAAAARADGQARLAQLQRSGQGDLPAKATVSRAQPQGLPSRVIDTVLQADSTKLPAYAGIDLGEQGFVVVRIDAVLPREEQAGDAAALRGQYGQAVASAETRAYLDALKSRYRVDTSRAASADAAASEAAR